MRPIILIPARMASTRLPGKPLAMIKGEPMIVHVWRLACKAGYGDVAVACDGREIADVIEEAGGRAVLTDPSLPSGSDRIWDALGQVDAQDSHDIIINLQGDMPTFDPRIIKSAVSLLASPAVDIATLAAPIRDDEEMQDPAVVKAVIEKNTGRALTFTRAPVAGGYHHIGIYAYRKAALERFVQLPPSPLEKKEKLEQLRATEAGMRIDVALVDTVPLGVDTPETLEKARAWYEKNSA